MISRRHLLIALPFAAGSLYAAPLLSTPTRPSKHTKAKKQSRSRMVYPGIDLLEQTGFKQLHGKRVGLLTHPAGVNRNRISSIDILNRDSKVRLVALFGPEHGIYGNEQANVAVKNRLDRRTGLPVYSLYGRTRRPTREMLENLDIMVIDLQDLGVRSYTYVSCMKYCIEECFKMGVEVCILDRPNPIGGLKVDGPPIEKQWMSYVGAYPVPYVHGLTIGELAIMAKEEGWLDLDADTLKKGKLKVIKMKGWTRDTMWTSTGMKWVPTSPAIPNVSAAMGYSMTGLGAQIGGFVHGHGSRYPFRALQFKGKSPDLLYKELINKRIPGLDYRIIRFNDKGGNSTRGVFVLVKNWRNLRPTEISFHMMQLACKFHNQQGKPNPFAIASQSEMTLFNKHTGSTEWWDAISTKGHKVNVPYFIKKWSRNATNFQNQSKKYWLYS